MSKKRGMIAASLAAAFSAWTGMVRADSILAVPEPAGSQRELVEWSPNITFTRTAGETSATEATGTFTIGFTSSTTGLLTDAARFNASGENGTAGVIFTSFSITGQIDVKNTGAGYTATFGGPTMENIVGMALPTSSPATWQSLNFNNSSMLDTFEMNLDGSTVDPLAFLFTRGTTTYFTNPNEPYILAQVKKIQAGTGTADDPFVGTDFFITGGTMKSWDPLQYKVDIFGDPLPLPATLAMGAIDILAVGLATVLYRKLKSA